MKAGAKKALKAASWKLAEVNQKILLPGSADCQPKCGLIFIWGAPGVGGAFSGTMQRGTTVQLVARYCSPTCFGRKQ